MSRAEASVEKCLRVLNEPHFEKCCWSLSFNRSILLTAEPQSTPSARLFPCKCSWSLQRSFSPLNLSSAIFGFFLNPQASHRRLIKFNHIVLYSIICWLCHSHCLSCDTVPMYNYTLHFYFVCWLI